MLNIVIAGVGGQGSVLASKILAQAALAQGWHVRTAETIGMAQRGGSVLGHVRIGNDGEVVHAPLVAQGTADLLIALEPGEGLRALPFLSQAGLLVTSTTGIPSVVANLAGEPYDVEAILVRLRACAPHYAEVDAQAICQQVGTPKVLNVAMLAAAVHASAQQGCGVNGAISADQLEEALQACVKPQFLDMNLAAIRAATR